MTFIAFAASALRGVRRALLAGLFLAPPAAAAPPDPLMEPGPLADIVEGSPKAPIAIIEYGSVTCSHCAAFHRDVWPSLKARYVDTGKVRFIFREFPLDPRSVVGFMLARCIGPDKRDGLIDLLFDQQDSWAFVDKPAGPLLALVKQKGMSQIDFETCVHNQSLFDAVIKSHDLAAARLGIDTTPTFFVNGVKLTGETPIGEFDKLLAPMLP